MKKLNLNKIIRIFQLLIILLQILCVIYITYYFKIDTLLVLSIVFLVFTKEIQAILSIEKFFDERFIVNASESLKILFTMFEKYIELRIEDTNKNLILRNHLIRQFIEEFKKVNHKNMIK